jgi:hypothetical protein
MNSKDFEVKIKEIDDRFSVVENPNRPGLSNIFFIGKNYDLPVISSIDIREEVDQSYRYEFPNGMRSRYWTQGEVLGRLEEFLKDFKDGKHDGLYE